MHGSFVRCGTEKPARKTAFVNTKINTSGKAGKSFITELISWLKQFNSDSDLNSIALKAFMMLPSLILQRPSATSKSKDHCLAIERRFSLLRQGELNLLKKEVKFSGKTEGIKRELNLSKKYPKFLQIW